jgi:hypothetical protein
MSIGTEDPNWRIVEKIAALLEKGLAPTAMVS